MLMAYRKLAADGLFTGTELLGSDAVLVISDNGYVEGIIPASEAGKGIERFAGILSPGFVNCHCHLELSHLKGLLPRGLGMTAFLLGVIQQRGALLDQIYDAISAAEAEMMEGGIVAVGDICNTSDTLYQKKLNKLYYHNFIEVAGFPAAAAIPRFAAASQLLRELSACAPSSIVPHAPYSVSAALFGLIDSEEALLTIHNQESKAENEFFATGSGELLNLYRSLGIDIKDFRPAGRSSLQSYMSLLSPFHRIILVHNVHTDEEDLRFVGQRMKLLYWCLCPNANFYIGGQLPDVLMIERFTDQFVLGTDSLASNNALSILEELKTLQSAFPMLSTAKVLKWATANGADALGISKQYGSFTKGKKPGVVLIENLAGNNLCAASTSRLIIPA